MGKVRKEGSMVSNGVRALGWESSVCISALKGCWVALTKIREHGVSVFEV